MPYWKDNSITPERKKEVLDAFLRLLIVQGVADTSVRDLSSAIKLQSAGMYYYFSTKEDLVATCAEEAEKRLEHELIAALTKKIVEPHEFFMRLKAKSRQMAPMMKFYLQVCSTPKYNELLKDSLASIPERYEYYASRYAREIGCTTEELVPHLYRCVITMTNTMVFGENAYNQQHIDLIELAIVDLIGKYKMI